MPKYLCMQRNLPSADGPKGQKPSPAQMQEMYAQFGAWQAKFKKNLVDMGGSSARDGSSPPSLRRTDRSWRSRNWSAAT